METRAHHVVIGLFTLIVFSATLFFGLWLTHSSTDRQFTFYDVVFNESVNGLSQGSSVLYNGIRVGEVVQLRLDTENPGKVWARTRVAASTPIREDTQARLAVAGITGMANIQFSRGSVSSPMLLGKDGQIAVIVATPSPLGQLLTNSEDFMLNVNQLLARLNEIVTPDNQQHLASMLKNLDQLTQTMGDQRGNIKDMLQQLTLASKQVNEILAQTNRLVRNTNGLVDGQGKRLVTDAANTMASLEKTSAILNQLISQNQDALNRGLQGVGQVGPALEELRRTLTILRSSVTRLDESPPALLWGRERTREFAP